MSIDNFIWAPAGVRNSRSIPCRKYKSWEEMIAVESPAAMPHQVFLAHGGNILIDEQYLFESADDARWFWNEGYKELLYVDDKGASMSYDRMTLWVDGKEIDSRGYSDESHRQEVTEHGMKDQQYRNQRQATVEGIATGRFDPRSGTGVRGRNDAH